MILGKNILMECTSSYQALLNASQTINGAEAITGGPEHGTHGLILTSILAFIIVQLIPDLDALKLGY